MKASAYLSLTPKVSSLKRMKIDLKDPLELNTPNP